MPTADFSQESEARRSHSADYEGRFSSHAKRKHGKRGAVISDGLGTYSEGRGPLGPFEARHCAPWLPNGKGRGTTGAPPAKGKGTRHEP